jgi:hypothetical protein
MIHDPARLRFALKCLKLARDEMKAHGRTFMTPRQNLFDIAVQYGGNIALTRQEIMAAARMLRSRHAAAASKRKYRSTGTGAEGPFAIEVEAVSPADAFVEVSLNVRGETAVDTLLDLATGQDVLDDIDPDDPVL